VLERMEARNAALTSYRVRVHVDMHTSVPFYSPKLDGTAYYKSPGDFALVFDSVPGYAKGFQRLFDDVGDPTGWEKDSNIAFRGETQHDGHPMLVLDMTKKIHSDQLTDAVAYVDPQTYQLAEMDWHYTNGQSVVMKQTYANQNGFSLVVRQHVEGNRRIRFWGDAQYETYETNVPIDDKVFAHD